MTSSYGILPSMAKKSPLDLPPGMMDLIATAERFKLDPATERLINDAGALTDSRLAALSLVQTPHEARAWREMVSVFERAAQDYEKQFALVRATLAQDEQFAISTFSHFRESWLKEAANLDLIQARHSELIALTEGSLARMATLEFGTLFGLEKQSHVFDRTIRTLTDSLASLYRHDADTRPLPPLVLSRPPEEVYVHVAAVEALTLEETREDAQDLLVEDAESGLLPLLDQLGPPFVRKWQGARQALASRNPDRIAHISVSVRELFRLVLHHLAPDDKVQAWSQSPEDFDKGRPTRAARFRFVTRGLARSPVSEFLARDFSGTLELVTLFDRGVHESNPRLTERQVRLMMLRMDQYLRFLLEVSREAGH